MTDETPKPANDAAKASWVTKVTGRYHDNGGFKAAAAESWEQVKGIVGKDVETKTRLKGFGRVASVGVGAYIATGALQSKNADGTDRGALHRLGNLVVGGGAMAAGVVAHGR